MTYASTNWKPRPALGGSLIALSLLFTWGFYIVAMGLFFELFSVDNFLDGYAGRIAAAAICFIWASIEHLAWAFGIHFFSQKLPGMKPHNALRWTARVSGYLNSGTMLLIAFCFLFEVIVDAAPEAPGIGIILAFFAIPALLVFRAVVAITLGLWMIRFADTLKRNIYRTQTWMITIWYGVVLTMLAGFSILAVAGELLSKSFPSVFDGSTVFIVFLSLIGFPLPYVAIFVYFLARQSSNIATLESALPMMPQNFVAQDEPAPSKPAK